MDEEEERFDAVLVLVGDRKISVVKLVRETLGLSLGEAKDFIERVPQTVKENLSRAEAEMLERRFDAVGAYLTLRPLPD